MQKHFILPSFIFLFFLAVAPAHSQVFEKGTKLIDAGFQLQDDFLPIFGNFEIGVTDDIGVGAKLSFSRKNMTNFTGIQAVGNYHFNRLMNLQIEQMDLFGGLGMGAYIASINAYGDRFSTKAFLATPFIGSRYFFNDKIGAVGKIGVDVYRYRIDDYGYYGGSYVETFRRLSLSLGVTFRM